jgi:hypothetical protein
MVREKWRRRRWPVFSLIDVMRWLMALMAEWQA